MPRFVEFARENARTSNPEEPMFTLQARGLLSLNNAVFRALGQPAHVALLYDADERIIALRSVAADHENAYRVRPQSGSYLVGTQGFISYHGLKPLVAQRFIAHDYGESVWGFALTEGRAVTNRRGAPKRRPALTSLWRATTDGFEVPALMRMNDAAPPQPAWRARAAADEPPSIRIAALVACEPLGHTLSTSDLRQRFLSFLESPSVTKIIASISQIDRSSSWKRWAGHGRLNLEAGLISDHTANEVLSPIAWARMLLPDVGMSSFGRDPRYAEIILHIEPQRPDGSLADSGDIRAWHERFTQALALPDALNGFLTESLELDTSEDPPAQLGISLKARHAISELVDLEDLKPLEGSSPSNWYSGWTIADPNGQPPEKVAIELLRQMCDYTLYVDEYEPILESLIA